MARRPTPRAQRSSLVPAFVAGGVILVAAVGVLLLVAQARPPSHAGEPGPPAEKEDPFAGIPDEVPPPARGAADPFAAARRERPDATETGDLGEVWTRALALAAEGLALAEAAGAARDDGDVQGFKTKGALAKQALEEALDVSRELEEELLREQGETHPDARAVQRTRSKWRLRLVALKKTVGS